MLAVEIIEGVRSALDKYSDWRCYRQNKGAAVFVRPDHAVIMLQEYDALKLLQGIGTASAVVGAFDRYLTSLLRKALFGRVFAPSDGARDGQRAGCSVRRMVVAVTAGDPESGGFMRSSCR